MKIPRFEHHRPENYNAELSALLPTGHSVYMEIDPVVAFMHTVKICKNCKEVELSPISPNTAGTGFTELLSPDTNIISFTKADPGGIMYSMFITGPIIETRTTIGYHYPGQTDFDYMRRAAQLCEFMNEFLSPLLKGFDGKNVDPDVMIEGIFAMFPDSAERDFLSRILRRSDKTLKEFIPDYDDPEGREAYT